MGKPGQRNSYCKIIDKPELKSPLRNLAEGSATIFLWAVWIYWMMPLVTLFLWVFGIRMFYKSIFDQVNFPELASILYYGGIAIAVILAVNLVWVHYNYHIFRKVGNRRKENKPCLDSKLTERFGIDQVNLDKARKSNRLEVTLENGKVAIDSFS